MSRHLDFFFAHTSPWTYFATPRVREIVEDQGLDLHLRPYNIFSVFKKNGTKAVGDRPLPVQKNRLNELRRWSEHLQMPVNVHPKHFPVDPTPSAKMLLAVGDGVGAPLDFAWAAMRGCWAEERDISNPDTLIEIANECGLDGPALLKTSEGSEIAERLEKNTQDALENDVFGAPTFLFEGELYWGQDRVKFLRKAAEGSS